MYTWRLKSAVAVADGANEGADEAGREKESESGERKRDRDYEGFSSFLNTS